MGEIRIPRTEIRKQESIIEGDCFSKNGKLFWDNPNKWEYLVHGVIHFPGIIPHGHCWLERDGLVFDYSNENIVENFPTGVFYKLGRIIGKHGLLRRYDMKQAAKFMVETGHYGSWHLNTEY